MVLIGREVRQVNSKDLLVLPRPSSVRNPTARSPQSEMGPRFTLGLFGFVSDSTFRLNGTRLPPESCVFEA